MNVSSSGAQVTFAASNTAPLRVAYTILLSGSAGTATASASIATTVQSGTPPNFYFDNTASTPGILGELAIPAGGSGQIQLRTYTTNSLPANYEVQLAANGLPAGMTAAFSPPSIIPGQTVTVTLSANSSAPIAQNAITIVGTPLAPVPAESVGLLADVTGAGSTLPNNRTDYLSTEGTPSAAVYDSVHNLIFSSNPSWNRVDVISNASHKIVKSIPVMGPRGLDITQDDSKVWVATASQQVYCVDTSSFAATRYMLPNFSFYQDPTVSVWQARQVFALADGTLFRECLAWLDGNFGRVPAIVGPHNELAHSAQSSNRGPIRRVLGSPGAHG